MIIITWKRCAMLAMKRDISIAIGAAVRMRQELQPKRLHKHSSPGGRLGGSNFLSHARGLETHIPALFSRAE